MSDELALTVKTIQGDVYNVNATGSNTIAELKQRIEEVASVPVAQQRVIFAGHVMKDHMTVDEYGMSLPSHPHPYLHTHSLYTHSPLTHTQHTHTHNTHQHITRMTTTNNTFSKGRKKSTFL